MAIRWGNPWTKKLEDECPTEVVDLYQEQARRAPTEAAIKKDPASLYYLFGHGNGAMATGQNMEPVIDAENIALWDQAFAHLLSCSVFQALGLLFKHGSGYNRTVYFYVSTFPNSVAEQYFESDHTAIREWWKNATMAETRAAVKKSYSDWFAKGLPGNDYLPWDRDSYVTTGPDDARPGPISGIKKLTAYYYNVTEAESGTIGDLTKGGNDIWTILWPIPKEGTYKLIYEGEDMEGVKTRKETGEFKVTFPPSGIHIDPISPKGGETINARKVEISVYAWYEEPQ
jgi:hypothetical protein